MPRDASTKTSSKARPPRRVVRDLEYASREAKIEAALAECTRLVQAKENLNWSHLSAQFGVPRKTLTSRFKGERKDRRNGHAEQQLLSPEEEQALTDWVCLRGFAGLPYSLATTTAECFRLTGKKPGKKWYKNFLKRHDDRIRCCRAYGLDPKRAKNFTRPLVRKHFDELWAVILEYKIPIENIFNMDEKGLQVGGGRNNDRKKYLFSRDDHCRYMLKSDNLELITLIEAICADGTAPIPVSIVAKPGDLGKEWFSPDFVHRDCIGFVAASENGWTNDKLCRDWFEQVFVPNAAAHNKSGRPILLIFDGHGSHVTPEMKEYAFEKGVILFLLPSKTSHMLQPLDVGVFNHVQRLWEDRTRDRAMELDPVTREDVIVEYLDIRQQAFQAKYIADAWRRSGIEPFNPDIFSDDLFAPSQHYSTVAHVPKATQEFATVNTSPISARFTSDVEWEGEVDDDSDEDGSSASGSDMLVDPDSVPRTPSPRARSISPVPWRIAHPPSSVRRMQERQGSEPATPSHKRTADVQPRPTSLPPSSPPPASPPSPPRPPPVYSVPRLPEATREQYRQASKTLSAQLSRRPLLPPSSSAGSSEQLSDGRRTRAFMARLASRSSATHGEESDGERANRLEQELWYAKETLQLVNSTLQGAEAHLSLAITENERWRKVNERKETKRAKKKKGEPSAAITIKSGPITAPHMWEMYKASRDEQLAEEARANEQAAAKEAAQQQLNDELNDIVRDPEYEFTGTWASYKNGKVDGIRKLAHDLRIELHDANRKNKTKAELVKEIEAHFASREDLKSLKRYCALWKRAPPASSAHDSGAGHVASAQQSQAGARGADVPDDYFRHQYTLPSVRASPGPGPSSLAARQDRRRQQPTSPSASPFPPPNDLPFVPYGHPGLEHSPLPPFLQLDFGSTSSASHRQRQLNHPAVPVHPTYLPPIDRSWTPANASATAHDALGAPGPVPGPSTLVARRDRAPPIHHQPNPFFQLSHRPPSPPSPQ